MAENTISGGTADDPALSAPSHPSDLGTLGKYRVLKLLGKGGMGAVFLGYDELLEREVALKVMLPSFATHPAARDRFLREARLAARVKSDHVAPIYEVGEENESPFLAMEYLRGLSLEHYLREKSPPTVPQAVRIARETAAGLAAAHALGLVHRDIKPANLWLEAPRGRVKLLDFGLARQQDDTAVTVDGQVVGTPAFMSPEQARGEKVDHRTDLFSLGAVLYRMLTGRLPFPGATVMETLIRLTTEDPPPVRTLNSAVPESLAGLVERLLSKNPAARPESAREVLAALKPSDAPLAVDYQPGNAFTGLGGETEPDTTRPADPIPMSPRRGMSRQLLFGLLFAGLAIASVGIWLATRPNSQKTVANPEPGPSPKPSEEKKEPPGPVPGSRFVTADLAGWDGDKTDWTAADGRLDRHVAKGAPKGGAAVLWSTRRYADFELRFRVRVVQETANAPELLFRATPPSKDGLIRSFGGIALRFKPASGVALVARSPGAAPKSLLPGTPAPWLNPTGKDTMNLPVGMELPVVVRCEGKRVVVTLDGEVCHDDVHFAVPAEGVIGWSPGGASDVTFSDIRFTELGKPATPGNWYPLVSGTDPAAWKTVVYGGPPRASVEDGRTILRLSVGTNTELMGTYCDFHLSFELQTPPPGPDGNTHIGNVSYNMAGDDRGFQLEMNLPNVFGKQNGWNPGCQAVRGEVRDGRIVPLPETTIPPKPPLGRGNPKPVGQWNRIDLVCLGDTCLHAINGKVVAVAAEMRHKQEPVTEGRVRLMPYCDLAVRDVKVRAITAVPEEFRGSKPDK